MVAALNVWSKMHDLGHATEGTRLREMSARFAQTVSSLAPRLAMIEI